MTLNINIDVNQIIQLIQQLPENKRLQVKYEIDKSLSKKIKQDESDEIRQLILNGPVMTEEEEIRYKQINNDFDKWTKNLFA